VVVSDPVLFAYSLDGSGGGAALHDGAGGWPADRDFPQNALVLMIWSKSPQFSGLG